MLQFCQFGAGRIGTVHAANIAGHPRACLRYVVDVDRRAADALATAYGARAASDPTQALSDPEVGAVLIASSTNTHVDLITAAARAGKSVFCEKPIDLDPQRVDACINDLDRAGVPFFVGFNRRFDPSFRALRHAIAAGDVGRVETVIITSRDPGPPPLEYLEVSGGIFRDMMIHDFDMARWLLGADPVEVFATGSCLVDQAIGDAGDVDTAMVVMHTSDGVLCHINNSRRATYGYDQRIEVLGDKGMLQAGNRHPTTVSRWGEDGVRSDKALFFFLERYREAYIAELEHFIVAVTDGGTPSPGAEDGRQALALADAADRSLRAGRPVAIGA
jgi:myo-inositol 2-dehydrogenase/D-chiro-inositol 1-dehydrogenase